MGAIDPIVFWPRVEIRTLKFASTATHKRWDEWVVVARVKEIAAAVHLANFYDTIPETESRVQTYSKSYFKEGKCESSRMKEE